MRVVRSSEQFVKFYSYPAVQNEWLKYKIQTSWMDYIKETIAQLKLVKLSAYNMSKGWLFKMSLADSLCK